MISRRTTRAVAESYQKRFYEQQYVLPHSRRTEDYVRQEELYDFLFDRDYSAWFCNKAKSIPKPRKLKNFVMQLHTGESLQKATPGWSWEDREKQGQEYIRNLAKDIIDHYEIDKTSHFNKRIEKNIEDLRKHLELDGYIYRDSLLLIPESDVLDIQEAQGVLNGLYSSLGLANKDLIEHHLKLSEEHYLASKWDDSISNSRKVLECLLREVAAIHSLKSEGSELSESLYTRPFKVRDYLERVGLLEAKEKSTLAEVYGLLSGTGGHPYMARKDQARLLRHLALTLSQFVMLRFGGWLKQGGRASQ